MLAGRTLDREKDSPEIYDANLAMARNLSEFLKKKPPGKLVYFSTVSVYGDQKTDLTIHEETQTNPSTHYGAAKREGEFLFQKAGEAAGFSVLILRPCRIYGPGVVYANYGPVQFIQEILKKKCVTLYGDGNELRDQLFIEDIVQMLDFLLQKNAAGIYNCATGKSVSFGEILDCLKKIAPFPFKIRFQPRTRPCIDQEFVMSKFRRLCPDFEFTSIEKGLKQTYDSLAESVREKPAITRSKT